MKGEGEESVKKKRSSLVTYDQVSIQLGVLHVLRRLFSAILSEKQNSQPLSSSSSFSPPRFSSSSSASSIAGIEEGTAGGGGVGAAASLGCDWRVTLVLTQRRIKDKREEKEEEKDEKEEEEEEARPSSSVSSCVSEKDSDNDYLCHLLRGFENEVLLLSSERREKPFSSFPDEKTSLLLAGDGEDSRETRRRSLSVEKSSPQKDGKAGEEEKKEENNQERREGNLSIERGKTSSSSSISSSSSSPSPSRALLCYINLANPSSSSSFVLCWW